MVCSSVRFCDANHPEMDGAVAQSFGAGLNKKRHRTERTGCHEHIVGPMGEFGLGRVAFGKEDIRDLDRPLFDLDVFLERFVPYSQAVPAPGARRDEHGLPRRGEAFRGQTGGRGSLRTTTRRTGGRLSFEAFGRDAHFQKFCPDILRAPARFPQGAQGQCVVAFGQPATGSVGDQGAVVEVRGGVV